MKDFKTTDFVQVELSYLLESGEPSKYWRNALYVMMQSGGHVVIYTDGTKQVLALGTQIRAAIKLNQ